LGQKEGKNKMSGWINPEKNVEGMLLDIGSGDPTTLELQKAGYVLNDIEPHKGIDLVCNILDLKKYINNDWCTEVFSSHILEHFTRKEIEVVMEIVKDILKPGGLFNIVVPNFEWHARLVLNFEPERAIYYAYGGQLDEFDIHKNGFTTITLKNLLERHGFSIKRMDNSASISCEAIKI
jgi:predicted SAM-dependent methyltransferase